MSEALFCVGVWVVFAAGLTMWINMTRWTSQLTNAFIGAGNQVYVGTGAVIAVLSKTYSKVGTSFRSKNSPSAAVTVGFSQYTTAQAYGNQNLVTFMTHGKIFTLRQRRRQRLLQGTGLLGAQSTLTPGRSGRKIGSRKQALICVPA